MESGDVPVQAPQKKMMAAAITRLTNTRRLKMKGRNVLHQLCLVFV
jgi:hypothetical protein